MADVNRGLVARIANDKWVILAVPILLFGVSLYIQPTLNPDSARGLYTLRNMLEGGAFNELVGPDPGNIAYDISEFDTTFSPGQYLAPGLFIWLGVGYKLAISLTVLIS